ncbi:hypothetical protein QWY84_16175 [Aquisalimonas lutea]|uniref:hypothetical protein n=1 Tax=Aquisalimonas lutea TaxID=1327750 RepID=UPI0025B2A33B|nr:hypothetical protein [Aquisalimonas lutea]MDN3519153.1 hypothetical protein [Aquisalimonas lutea]
MTRFLSIVVLLVAGYLAFSIFMMVSTDSAVFTEINSEFSRSTTPSWFVETFMHPATGYVVVALCIALLVKEVLVKSAKACLGINIAMLAVFGVFSYQFVPPLVG